ncbi:MAG: hypothetical protein ACREF4_01150 [Gammaproteobacteria bacterium]
MLVAVAMCLVALSGSRDGSAQDLGNPKYRFQDRQGPDRKEGIRPLERSGAYIDLVGVLFDVPVTRSGGEREQRLRLGFFLPERERLVRIEVRDYDRFRAAKYHYWMIPTQTVFDSGFQEFAWDADLARELGIRPDELGAVAELGGHGHIIVVPLLLGAAPFPATVRAQGVRFVFIPNETMTVEYSLYPKGNPSHPLLRGAGEQWLKGQRVELRWPGRNRSGEPASDGHYVLALTVTFTTPRGVKEKIPRDYTFHYRPNVMAK